MDANVKQALVDIVGDDNFTDTLIDMVSYSYDSSEHSHRPSCAIWPTSTEQVAAVMKFASEHKLPVIPRGAGTGLSGMAVPVNQPGHHHIFGSVDHLRSPEFVFEFCGGAYGNDPIT